jgi:hypothetical protein
MQNSILIIMGSIVAAAVVLRLAQRFSTPSKRKESNDFTGAVVTVIGTMYAVILAFLLSGLWNHYQQAREDAQLEAVDVVNIFRVANQFPEPQRHAIKTLAHKYAEIVLSEEWPEMLKGQVPHGGGPILDQLWATAGWANLSQSGQALAMGQLMNSLNSLSQHRGIRILQSSDSLAPILWAVLIAGAIVTVVAACFFGVPDFRFHLLQVMVLSFLISLVLVAISAVERPYQGAVRVRPDGLLYVLRTMEQERQFPSIALPPTP